MSDPTQWQKNNDEYLTKMLSWLRLRLQRLALVNRHQNDGAESEEEVTEASLETLHKLAAEIASLESGPLVPALLLLGRHFHLSPFERQTLFLCAAMEFDTRVARLCARAQDDPKKNYPTFALALTLFDEPSWDALSPERPLR